MGKPNIVSDIIKIAAKNPKRIVFPEGLETRILDAIPIILKKRIAKPILLGDVRKMKLALRKRGVSFEKVILINPELSDKRQLYADELLRLRKHKGMTAREAFKLAADLTYYGTLMVHLGDADGLVSGAVHSTGDTVRPALQIIKTHEAYHKVSGLFLMMLEDNQNYLFADCAVTPDPTSKELAQIAHDSVITARKFDMIPKVAMLSFSTNGSAKHPLVDKVRNAVKIFRRLVPKVPVEGEIQVDAALSPIVRKTKYPDSKFKGKANVLIFPDLNSGNISYKLVERLAGAKAVGPILQGLNKPINDLSRGCSVEDIVDVTAITVVEGNEK